MKAEIVHGRLIVTPGTDAELDQIMRWAESVPLFRVLGFSQVSQHFQIDVMRPIARGASPTAEESVERKLSQGALKAEAFHEIERIRFLSKRRTK